MAIGMKKNNNEVHQNILALLLEKSRLVYSGVTIKLFNYKNSTKKRNETIYEADKFNISVRSNSDAFQNDKVSEDDENDPRTV
jgi:hypothetical protein